MESSTWNLDEHLEPLPGALASLRGAAPQDGAEPWMETRTWEQRRLGSWWRAQNAETQSEKQRILIIKRCGRVPGSGLDGDSDLFQCRESRRPATVTRIQSSLGRAYLGGMWMRRCRASRPQRPHRAG